jgi:hypothetical protein
MLYSSLSLYPLSFPYAAAAAPDTTSIISLVIAA